MLTVGKVLCSGGEQLGTHKKGCTRPQTAYFFCGTGAQEGMWQLAAFLQEKAHILIRAPLPCYGHCWRLCNLLQPPAHPLSISFLPAKTQRRAPSMHMRARAQLGCWLQIAGDPGTIGDGEEVLSVGKPHPASSWSSPFCYFTHSQSDEMTSSCVAQRAWSITCSTVTQ